MKRLLFLLAPMLALMAGLPAAAQDLVSARVVAVCGTPDSTPVVGNAYPLTQDATLTLCTAGGGGGGGGGAVTVANGADVTQGAIADAAWSGTGNGTLVAISKSIRGLLAGTLTVGTHAVTQSGTWNVGAVTSITNPVAVTGTFWQATQPVSGTFWQATQPVSAAALPLPSGAATAANQTATQGTFGAITGNRTVLYDTTGTAIDFTAAAPVYNAAATTTDASSTVTTGGTFQTVFTSSSTRRGCLIQNPITATETLFVYEGTGTATTAKSINLAPGATFNCGAPGMVVTGLVQVTGATTGHAFVAKSQ